MEIALQRADTKSKQTYIFTMESMIISIITRLRLLSDTTMNFCWDFNTDPLSYGSRIEAQTWVDFVRVSAHVRMSNWGNVSGIVP